MNCAGLGDLDDHNGVLHHARVPKGTYAYFATLDETLTPAFPLLWASIFMGYTRHDGNWDHLVVLLVLPKQ